jgi:hypothetical protein
LRSRDAAEPEADRRDRPRLPAGEVLDVGQDPIAVRAREVAAQALDPLGGGVGEVGVPGIAVVPELVAGRAQRARQRVHLLAGLGGAGVELRTDLPARLLACLLRALLELLARLAHHLLRLALGLAGFLGDLTHPVCLLSALPVRRVYPPWTAGNMHIDARPRTGGRRGEAGYHKRVRVRGRCAADSP